MFVYTPPMHAMIQREPVVQRLERRWECFATEDQANQWALDMEEAGWQVIEFKRDLFADVFSVLKPWSVTVQAPAYVAKRVA